MASTICFVQVLEVEKAIPAESTGSLIPIPPRQTGNVNRLNSDADTSPSKIAGQKIAFIWSRKERKEALPWNYALHKGPFKLH